VVIGTECIGSCNLKLPYDHNHGGLSGRGVFDTTLCDKFIGDLGRGGVFLGVRFPPTKKTDRHYITEILLKVALNTIILTLVLMMVICYGGGKKNIIKTKVRIIVFNATFNNISVI
jgi:hypothetical protein